ncbi:hypothetical protein MNBD_GAMMA11-3383 [hydrothermal vent metagenome]|uniref:Yip1 domain-containing protein n=1 Tax=hydrothermal vent metagenome TaxID=652676 RepID=A0A3B0XAI8_9ZZZZ
MYHFFKTLWGNLLLSKGPQDFACSSVLLWLCLLASVVTGVPALLSKVGFAYAVLAAVVDVLVLLLFVYLGLQAFSKLARFVQSATALVSVSVVFQMIAFLLLAPLETAQAQDQANGMAGLALLFLSWYLAVCTHIFRQVFGVQLPVAMILTICYIVINRLAVGIFMPELL